MTMISIQSADGRITTTEVRDWRPASQHLTRRKRGTRAGTATVRIDLRADSGDGARRTDHFEWLRRPPGEDESRTTLWTHVDEYDGCWRVEYGYTGRSWALFGPDGWPFGIELARTQDEAVTEASVYIAKARARHHDRRRRSCRSPGAPPPHPV